MKADIHPSYQDAEIRCACGNVIKTRSIKKTTIIGICNACHPFYTGQQKFVDTAGRVDKFSQRFAEIEAALSEPNAFDNPQRAQELSREYARLKELVASGQSYLKVATDLAENQKLLASEPSDSELALMAREEINRLE